MRKNIIAKLKLYRKMTNSQEYNKYLDSLTDEDKYILPPPNDGEIITKGG